MKFLLLVNFFFTSLLISKNEVWAKKINILVKAKNKKGVQSAQKLVNGVMKQTCNNVLSTKVTQKEMDSLKNDPDIEMVEVDTKVKSLKSDLRVRTHKKKKKQKEDVPYGIEMVLEDLNFWKNLPSPSKEVKVCVADTGFAKGHADLPDDAIGKDSKENGSWDKDPVGHGTHVAGTVAAIGGNNKGVRGVIPDNMGKKFKLVIGKALDDNGSGLTSGVLQAVCDCVDQGATVINLSLGGGGSDKISEDTYKFLYEQHDVIIIAAAGNDGNSEKSYPASYGAVMSVAAIDSKKNIASFSQRNNQVEISAPGVSVKSTIPNNRYDSFDGTSMSSPHVAGVAGLLRLYFPNCKNYQVRNAMLKSAKDISTNGCDSRSGFGVVRAKQAYDLLSESCGGNIGDKKPVGGCAQLGNSNADDDTGDDGGNDDRNGDDGYGYGDDYSYDDDYSYGDDRNRDDYDDDYSFDDDNSYDDDRFDDDYNFDDDRNMDDYDDDYNYDDDRRRDDNYDDDYGYGYDDDRRMDDYDDDRFDDDYSFDDDRLFDDDRSIDDDYDDDYGYGYDDDYSYDDDRRVDDYDDDRFDDDRNRDDYDDDYGYYDDDRSMDDYDDDYGYYDDDYEYDDDYYGGNKGNGKKNKKKKNEKKKNEKKKKNNKNKNNKNSKEE